MSSTVEQIKDRLSIEDVVGSYIKLLRAGKNLKAPCPFHNDADPSFYVSPERESYYCFGCGAKGDIFSFVQEYEGLDFPGALKVLAERAGVEITYEKGSSNKGEKDTLVAILEAACSFFEEALTKNTEATQYLLDRGIEKVSRGAWRLGFAPDSWEKLTHHLKAKGFKDEALRASGMVKKRDGKEGLYDAFRSRIMFPITDTSGRVIAFSGRVFPPTPYGEEATGERSAKYINNPESIVFKKSKTLYGLHLAKQALRKYDFAIIVEGQTDVLMSQQAGFTNTVAPLGTALTHEHLTLLGRFTKNLVLGLDADSAGLKAVGKSAELALASSFDVKVASLPLGSDPADVIAQDAHVWKSAIREAIHIIPFFLDHLETTIEDRRSFELAVHKHVLPYVARIENAIDRAHFVKIVAERLKVSGETITEELKKVAETSYQSLDQKEREPQTAETPKRSRGDTLIRKLVGFILWQEKVSEPIANIDKIQKQLFTITSTSDFALFYQDSEKDELMFEAESFFEGSDTVDRSIAEMLVSLEEEYMRERLTVLLSDLKEAESKQDAEKAKSILAECQTISKQIETLKQTHTM